MPPPPPIKSLQYAAAAAAAAAYVWHLASSFRSRMRISVPVNLAFDSTNVELVCTHLSYLLYDI